MIRYRSVLGMLAPLVVAVVLAGCGGAGSTPAVATADSTGSAPPAKATVDAAGAWADCMRSAGVPMIRTTDGQDQVDKSKLTSLDQVDQASRKCQSLQPSGSTSAGVAAADLERARQLSACVRKHGVPDYPDPDPRTGSVELPPALATRLKSDRTFLAALDACRDPRAGSTGIAGG